MYHKMQLLFMPCYSLKHAITIVCSSFNTHTHERRFKSVSGALSAASLLTHQCEYESGLAPETRARLQFGEAVVLAGAQREQARAAECAPGAAPAAGFGAGGPRALVQALPRRRRHVQHL